MAFRPDVTFWPDLAFGPDMAIWTKIDFQPEMVFQQKWLYDHKYFCQISNGLLARNVFLLNFIFSLENFLTIIILSNKTALLLKVLKGLARL